MSVGTRLVASGAGATVAEIRAEIVRAIDAPAPPDWRAVRGARFTLGGHDDARTNVALTGEPLVAEDFARIARCEVVR